MPVAGESEINRQKEIKADFNKPVTTDLYTDVLDLEKARAAEIRGAASWAAPPRVSSGEGY
jgi:hypothetical protein